MTFLEVGFLANILKGELADSQNVKNDLPDNGKLPWQRATMVTSRPSLTEKGPITATNYGLVQYNINTSLTHV